MRGHQSLPRLLLGILLMLAGRAAAQEPSEAIRPTELEVRLGFSTELRPGVLRSFLVLDEDIVRVEKLDEQTLRLQGLVAGRTVVLVWTEAGRELYAVRVLYPPAVAPFVSWGSPGSPFVTGSWEVSYEQTSSNLGGLDLALLRQSFFSQERVGENLVMVHAELFQIPRGSLELFNISTAAVRLERPGLTVELADFGLALAGETPVPYISPVGLRGAHVVLHSGDKKVELFAGVTVPSHYLRLERTRDLVGGAVHWSPNSRWRLRWTGGYVAAPQQSPSGAFAREHSGFALFDLEYKLHGAWALEASAGGSTRGGLVRGALRYFTPRSSLLVQGKLSAAQFPLNQMGLLASGPRSLTIQGLRYLRPDWSIGGSLQVGRADLRFPTLQFRRNFVSSLSTQWRFSPQYSVSAQVNLTRDGNEPPPPAREPRPSAGVWMWRFYLASLRVG